MTMQNDPQAAFIDSARRLQNRIVTPCAAPQPATIPAANAERRRRSLNTCHRYAQTEQTRKVRLRASRAYVPELAARIEDDPNLTDGARRCARKRGRRACWNRSRRRRRCRRSRWGWACWAR